MAESSESASSRPAPGSAASHGDARRDLAGRVPWLLYAPAAAVLIALVVFPPIRIHSLRTIVAPSMAGAFAPTEFAAKFWAEKLVPASERATDARTLALALRQDAKAAVSRYGRAVGIGGTICFFVQGEGRVAGANEDGVQVRVADGVAPWLLQTAPVFGNTIRDGTGLLDVNAFTNSQDFNALSAALNQLVEQRAQPALRAPLPSGTVIRFAGCAEINQLDGDVGALRIVPIRAEVVR